MRLLMWKQFVIDYLTFSKRERRGSISLIIIIGLLMLAPLLFPLFVKHSKIDASQFQKQIAALKLKENDSTNGYAKTYPDDDDRRYYATNKKYTIKGELFYFDPNIITAAQWKRLGVRDKTIATIQNYTSKGGKFYKPEDLAKIWGFFPNEIERLTQYIQIAAQPKKEYAVNTYEKKVYDRPKYAPTIVDVNSGDTTAYIALPGIGSKLAQRIINYRDRLGGFYKVDQIAETYGLPDSTWQKIKPRLQLSGAGIKQININTATADEMKTHPYLKWNLAKLIVEYRTQHGPYNSIADIKKIMLVTDEIFNKAAPYLKVN